MCVIYVTDSPCETVNLNFLSLTEINVYEDPRDTRSRDKFGHFTCFGNRIRSSDKVEFGYPFFGHLNKPQFYA